MEKEINTSGKMTWGFIWRFILYYIVISIILTVITYFMLGKVNMLVLSIFSVVTMGILIFFPTKLATSDVFKTRKMDDKIRCVAQRWSRLRPPGSRRGPPGQSGGWRQQKTAAHRRPTACHSSI